MKWLIALALIVSTQAKAQEFELDLKLQNLSRSCKGEVTGALESVGKKNKAVPDELKLTVIPRNAVGKVNYSYYFTTDGFELAPSVYGKSALVIKESTKENTVKFQLPALRADRFYTRILLVVAATDSKGRITKQSLPLTVSREAIIEKDDDIASNCTQVFPPQVESGLYDNENDTDMTITTSEGVAKLTEERKSKTLGWSIVPTVFTGNVGISLFGFSGSRLNGIAKQVNESSYTAVTHTLNPGDVGFRYSQKTRIKEAYNILKADGCGNFQQIPNGKIYLDREVTVNNLYKVSAPYDKKALEEALKSRLFGRPVINTCSELDKVAIPFAE